MNELYICVDSGGIPSRQIKRRQDFEGLSIPNSSTKQRPLLDSAPLWHREKRKDGQTGKEGIGDG